MIKIKRLRLEIITHDDPNKFGFDIPFESGLNIIAGKNSKGKSTISSCIYYAMGMEELLGAQNQKSLDKSLKTEFNTYDKRTNEVEKTHKILISKIFLELINSRNQVVTILRYINPGKEGDDKVKNVTVYESEFNKISAGVRQFPLFLRHPNNNEVGLGFYHWLAQFIGLDLPVVTNNAKSDGNSPLYLQTIFPAFFIEQTKGWSDFLATIPYFGIPNNKEKTIEFLLNLSELQISSERDRLAKTEKHLKDAWTMLYSRIQILATEYQANVINIPTSLTADNGELIAAGLTIKEEYEENHETLESLIEKYENRILALRPLPIKKVGDNKDSIRERLEQLYQEQNDFQEKFSEFDLKFDLQKKQLKTLHKHLENTKKELATQQGIRHVFDEALIKESIYNRCPTCTQSVSSDLMESEGVQIEQLTLNENIAYLNGQRKIIESTIQSLAKIVDEKAIIRRYYLKKQREFEEEIKSILRELISDDRDYSETDTLIRVSVEKRTDELKYLATRFQEQIDEMKSLSGAYRDLLVEKSKLEGGIESDRMKLNSFEETFKNYLFSFGYSSNEKWNIFIQQNLPFKYFPVFKFNVTDPQPQSIRTNSSASDFVRTIWAYSITLLKNAPMHPGLLMLDEPGQHSISSNSLKSLFGAASQFRDRQIIIFTSVERKGEENKWDLDDLLQNIKDERDYHIYRLDERGKSIDRLLD